MDTLDLSALFSTKSQAVDFSQRLAIVVKKVFETSFNPETALLEQFGIEKKEAFMTILRDNKVNAESRLAIKEFIEKVQQKIELMPVISLILAFEPDFATLQGLSQWFILNTQKQVLFDIKIDKSIIGGASIYSNVKYLYFSIRPIFDKIFDDMIVKPSVAARAAIPQKAS